MGTVEVRLDRIGLSSLGSIVFSGWILLKIFQFLCDSHTSGERERERTDITHFASAMEIHTAHV